MITMCALAAMGRSSDRLMLRRTNLGGISVVLFSRHGPRSACMLQSEDSGDDDDEFGAGRRMRMPPSSARSGPFTPAMAHGMGQARTTGRPARGAATTVGPAEDDDEEFSPYAYDPAWDDDDANDGDDGAETTHERWSRTSAPPAPPLSAPSRLAMPPPPRAPRAGMVTGGAGGK